MRPVLVSIPSKWPFFLALAVALGWFVRDGIVRRRRAPDAPRSAVPLFLAVGAIALMRFRSPSGSFIPRASTFTEAWQPIEVHSYGVMLGLSMIAGWFLTMRLAREDHVRTEDAGAIYMWTAIWSILGARALYVILKWNDEFARDPAEIFRAYNGGLVAYGGMIGGFLASCYGCWRRGIPLLQWADVSAPAVVLGTGITRIGCFLNGCDYGRRSDLPWAVSFPRDSAAWLLHYRAYQLPADAVRSFPVHPTQLYESLIGLALFAALMLVRRHRRFSGQVFLAWVIGYGTLRPLIEMLRDDVDERGHIPGVAAWLPAWVSPSELIGWSSVLLGLALLVTLVRRHRRAPQSLRYWERTLVLAGAEGGGDTSHWSNGGGGGGHGDDVGKVGNVGKVGARKVPPAREGGAAEPDGVSARLSGPVAPRRPRPGKKRPHRAHTKSR
jgi:prolipoprotein diacylglyceryl transferase